MEELDVSEAEGKERPLKLFATLKWHDVGIGSVLQGQTKKNLKEKSEVVPFRFAWVNLVVLES